MGYDTIAGKKSILKPVFCYSILIFACILVVIPFIWLIGRSLKSREELNMFTELGFYTFFPKEITGVNYVNLFAGETVQINFVQVFCNTVLTGIISVGANLLVNSLAAYSFARIKFYGRNTLFLLILFLLIIPADILLLPQYKLISSMRLMDTLIAVVLPSIANPFVIFFLRQFFLEIPKDIEEAATIDGCSRWRIFYGIMFPLVAGPVFTVSIIVFLAQWDNFIWPTTIISSLGNYVLQMAVAFLAVSQYELDLGLTYAGAVLSIIPVVILFISVQKYYVQSIVTSGIKG